MLKFFKNMLKFNQQEEVSVSDMQYLTSVLNSASIKAHYNENIRSNVLEVAKKVRNALNNKNNGFPHNTRKDALIALNRVKVHALVSGTPQDYTLFVQLDQITKDLETYS